MEIGRHYLKNKMGSTSEVAMDFFNEQNTLFNSFTKKKL